MINFRVQHPRWAELIRFLIVGGLATIVDMLLMGVVLYLCQPALYPHFYQVFYGGGQPSTWSTVLGTGVGFVGGLGFNYLLSISFVFIEKGQAKSWRGFGLFTILAVGGLAIHLLGMYLGYDLLGGNEWVVKIILTIIVLLYNYVTRKMLIFKKQEQQVDER